MIATLNCKNKFDQYKTFKYILNKNKIIEKLTTEKLKTIYTHKYVSKHIIVIFVYLRKNGKLYY